MKIESRNFNILFQENAFENVVCEMAAILFGGDELNRAISQIIAAWGGITYCTTCNRYDELKFIITQHLTIVINGIMAYQWSQHGHDPRYNRRLSIPRATHFDKKAISGIKYLVCILLKCGLVSMHTKHTKIKEPTRWSSLLGKV